MHTELLSQEDLDLLEEAKRVLNEFSITRVQDEVVTTVGTAMLGSDGEVYSSPNFYHSHIDPYYFVQRH